ncbi:MAG: LuxR C-terminal-related transcriptional regulator [Terriglobales bacterium]
MPTDRIQGQGIRVLVADGTRIHTDLLANALRCNPALDVFSHASDSAGLVETALNYQVDIAVIACRLAEEPLGGLEVLRKIRVLRPKVRGIILLDSSKPDIVLGAFRAGAKGLFSRDASLETLSECVRRVHAGEVWASPEQIAIALEALTASPTLRTGGSNGLSMLSKRELDVVLSLAEGLSNREIAARLGLSQHTIKNYLFKVFDKLGVSSRIELLFLTLNHSVAKNPLDQRDGNSPETGSSFASSRTAAEQGMPIAQISLATMYADGNGTRKDPRAAYMWYLICEKNVLDLQNSISFEKRKMAGLLTTDEILEAQKLASDHHKKPVQPTSLGFVHPVATGKAKV